MKSKTNLSGYFSRLAAALIMLASSASFAQTPSAPTFPAFPTKPVRIVVPFAAGGVADLTVRVVAQKLSDTWGQAVIVDNRPSAGGIVAGELVAKAEPDGHTLLLMSNGSAVSAGLFKTLPFDTQRDFAPLSTLGFFDIALVAAGDSKFATLADVLAYARANPGKLNVGSIAVGSTQNLVAEWFKQSAAIDVQVVPFNGTPAVITALRGGQIDVAVEIVAPIVGQVRGKALRLLATTGDKRSRLMPDVPSAREQGVLGLNAASWNALAAPAKTPKAIQVKLAADIAAAVESADVRKKLAEQMVDASSASPELTAELLGNEIKRWTAVIERAKIARQ